MTVQRAPLRPRSPAAQDQVHFLGVEFSRFDADRILEDLRELAYADRFSYVVTPNVDHLVGINCNNDIDLALRSREACLGAAICLCDSRILARLARFSGQHLDVLPGSDLTRELLLHGLKPGDRLALIGGTAHQLEWLSTNWPQLTCCQFIPRMGVLRDPQAQREIAEFVESVGCDYYLFAFGAPQSELVALQIRRRGLARGVALCIGASVDFLSGDKRRAPRWFQERSLEWAFRLVTEPRRLWRRYLVRGPRIFGYWWRHGRAGQQG